MPKSNPSLIEALHAAADRLDSGAKYEWGHMARCNCGHLLQSLTGLDDREISSAVDHRLDEWTEHAKTFCPQSGRAVDEVFEILESFGFLREDVIHLENLSDRQVLSRLGDNVHLQRNNRDDLVLYLRTMADLLSEKIDAEAAARAEEALLTSPMLMAGLMRR
ncbi:MAG: hypothetical protein AAGA96_11350 [Verrucomicrobiota bacterium]